METLPADLVLVSIGYKGEALSGLDKYFDASRGLLRHEHGQVDSARDGMGGLYASVSEQMRVDCLVRRRSF